MRKEMSIRKTASEIQQSSAARSRPRAEASLGKRLLDSMKELRAHLRAKFS